MESDEEIHRVRISDALGRLQHSGSWQGELDVSGWPEGLYVVEVTFRSGEVVAEKLLVQRVQ